MPFIDQTFLALTAYDKHIALQALPPPHPPSHSITIGIQKVPGRYSELPFPFFKLNFLDRYGSVFYTMENSRVFFRYSNSKRLHQIIVEKKLVTRWWLFALFDYTSFNPVMVSVCEIRHTSVRSTHVFFPSHTLISSLMFIQPNIQNHHKQVYNCIPEPVENLGNCTTFVQDLKTIMIFSNVKS